MKAKLKPLKPSLKLPRPLKGDGSDRWDFHKKLRKQGHREIGCGAFAYVFAKPKSNRCIKVGNRYDEYLEYVQFVGLNSDNPFFPKIYSVKIYREGFYAVEMERLRPYSKVGDKHRNLAFKRLGIKWLDDLECPNQMKAKSKHATHVKRVLQTVFRGNQPDIHTGNVMWRKFGINQHQLVITDPVA